MVEHRQESRKIRHKKGKSSRQGRDGDTSTVGKSVGVKERRMQVVCSKEFV